MASKPEELPSLDDDLTVRPAAPPRLRPRTVIPDDQVQANSRVLGEQWGAATHIRPQDSLTPLEPLRIDVPNYLARELRVRCAEDKVTIAYLVMKALQKDGFTVAEKDLVKDRYKRGKR
ncbi:MAG: hypothetical protein AB7F35_29915 [Acetobacteraceae bacterium]